MVIPFDDRDFGIEIFDLRRLHVPTLARHSRDQLVVVALFTPLLNPFFVCLAVKHERVQRPRYVTFVLATDFLAPFFMRSICPRHHISDRNIIVFSLNAQWVVQHKLRPMVFAFLVTPRPGRGRHSAGRTAVGDRSANGSSTAG